MSSTEIDSTIIRLIGDVSSYEEALETVETQSQKAAVEVEKLKTTVNDFDKIIDNAIEDKNFMDSIFKKTPNTDFDISDRINDMLELTRVQKDAKSIMEKVGDAFSKTAGSGMNLFNTGLAKLNNLSFEAKVGLAGMVATVSYQFGYWLSGAAEDLKTFEQELAKASKLNSEVMSARETSFSQRHSNEQSMLIGPNERGKHANEAAELAAREVASTSESLDIMKKRVEELAPTWLSLWQAGKYTHQQMESQLEMSEKSLEGYKNRLNGLIKEQGQFKDLGGGKFLDLRDLANAKKQYQGIIDQTKEVGKTEDEILRIRLESKNIYSSWINKISEANSKLKEQLEIEAKRKEEKETIESLQDQLNMIGMTESEILRYKMEKKGLDDQAINDAVTLQNEIDKALKNEERNIELREEANRNFEAGKRLTESLRTDEEKALDSMKEFNRLLKDGFITQETYNRAVKDLADQFEDIVGLAGEFDQLFNPNKKFSSAFLGLDKDISAKYNLAASNNNRLPKEFSQSSITKDDMLDALNTSNIVEVLKDIADNTKEPITLSEVEF